MFCVIVFLCAKRVNGGDCCHKPPAMIIMIALVIVYHYGSILLVAAFLCLFVASPVVSSLLFKALCWAESSFFVFQAA